MQCSEKFRKFILNCENKKAAAFAAELYETAAPREYADALVKISLVEAAAELNRHVPAFYFAEDELVRLLFPGENASCVDEAIDALCKSMRCAAHESRERSFRKAKAYILERICDNQLSAADAAMHVGLSPAGLVKLFSENMGMTPVEFIGKARVEYSIDCLKRNLSVAAVAQKAGFTNTEGYIRTFKKHRGMTPGEWKRNNLFL